MQFHSEFAYRRLEAAPKRRFDSLVYDIVDSHYALMTMMTYNAQLSDSQIRRLVQFITKKADAQTAINVCQPQFGRFAASQLSRLATIKE